MFSGKVPDLSKNGFVSAPPVGSITTEDILRGLNTDQVILKIDVEGAECKVRLIKITWLGGQLSMWCQTFILYNGDLGEQNARFIIQPYLYGPHIWGPFGSPLSKWCKKLHYFLVRILLGK